MAILNGAEALIGGTPLVRLPLCRRQNGLKADLLFKAEAKNLTGSVKDRIALALLDDGEARGLLKEGGAVVEPTSGNTGIALAALGRQRGYRVILTMPASAGEGRKRLMRAYGAEIVLTRAELGMRGAIDEAREIARKTGAYLPLQFENPANPRAHYLTTGPEIFRDCPLIDIFVAGVGTGGTLSGAGRFLKEKRPSVRVVAVEPSSSPVLSGGRAGRHRIEGIGAGFVPKTLDPSLIDEVVGVTDEEAFACAKELALSGMFAGASSGAALAAAKRLAAEAENEGKKIVAILPDCGDRSLCDP